MDYLKELVRENRSYRRFNQSVNISKEMLTDLINLARLSPSARNAQTIKYIISNTPERNDLIFPHLSWADYLKDWDGPVEGERPSAYLIMVNDSRISDAHYCDQGIAAQSILLGAVEKGFGGCIIAAVDKPKLQKDFDIPEYFKIIQVLALGKPVEKVVVEDAVDDEVKYYRDSNGVHHVPKRSLDDLILDF